MDIGQILILSGLVVLWIVALGVITVVSSNVALNSGAEPDSADVVAGVCIITYIALSAIGLGLLL